MPTIYCRSSIDYDHLIAYLENPPSRVLRTNNCLNTASYYLVQCKDHESAESVSLCLLNGLPESLRPWALVKLLSRAYDYVPRNGRLYRDYGAIYDSINVVLDQLVSVKIQDASRCLDVLGAYDMSCLDDAISEVEGWAHEWRAYDRSQEDDFQFLRSFGKLVRAVQHSSDEYEDSFVFAIAAIDRSIAFSYPPEDIQFVLERSRGLYDILCRHLLPFEEMRDLLTDWLDSWLSEVPPIDDFGQGIEW